MAEFKPMSKSDLFLRELLFKAEQGNVSIEELACSLVEATKERNELKKFFEKYKDVTAISLEPEEKIEECKAPQRIEITFKNGDTISYGKGEWDDYGYDGKAIMVKQKGAWIGIYNFDDVFCVELK